MNHRTSDQTFSRSKLNDKQVSFSTALVQKASVVISASHSTPLIVTPSMRVQGDEMICYPALRKQMSSCHTDVSNRDKWENKCSAESRE